MAVSRCSVWNQHPGSSSPGRAALPSFHLVFGCAWYGACLGGRKLVCFSQGLKIYSWIKAPRLCIAPHSPRIDFPKQPARVIFSRDGGSLPVPAPRHPPCPLQGYHKDIVHYPDSWGGDFLSGPDTKHSRADQLVCFCLEWTLIVKWPSFSVCAPARRL